MTIVATGPTEAMMEYLGLARYDEHVKDWRWDKFGDKGNLHVIDFYLHTSINGDHRCASTSST